MGIPVKIPTFESPPKEYDREYFESVLRSVRLYMQLINTNGEVHCSGIVVSALPTSSVGLKPGTLYNDSGTIKVV